MQRIRRELHIIFNPQDVSRFPFTRVFNQLILVVRDTRRLNAELRDLLTKKGIPFNKSDKKPVLLNLLKVAS
jgi:hypothetical protein